jgi:hypothetical protein
MVAKGKASRKADVRKPKLKKETIRDLDAKRHGKEVKGGQRPVNTESCIIRATCGCP